MALIRNEAATAIMQHDDLAIGSDNVVLLRAVEVSRLLGLSRSQTYQMISDGQLPVVRIGRAVRVPKQALAEWIRSNTAGSVKEAADCET